VWLPCTPLQQETPHCRGTLTLLPTPSHDVYCAAAVDAAVSASNAPPPPLAPSTIGVVDVLGLRTTPRGQHVLASDLGQLSNPAVIHVPSDAVSAALAAAGGDAAAVDDSDDDVDTGQRCPGAHFWLAGSDHK
jgi:hypothetical protein